MTNRNPVITNSLPTWVFIQSTASGNYRHEIQRVLSGFMVFVNVSDENGGYAFPQKFATYQAAFETLVHFRPGVKLTERINGAGNIENY